MLASLFIGAIVACLYYLWDVYSYWRRKGIKGPIPLPVFGNYASVLLGIKLEHELILGIYSDYPNEKYVGLYKGIKPVLLIRDPDEIKQVLLKDYDSFFERILPASIVFTKNILGTNDLEKYMAYRKAYSPLYTRSKISQTWPMSKIPTNKYLEFLDNMIDEGDCHDITLLQRKFSLEVFGALTIGREVGCFSKDNNIEIKWNEYTDCFTAQRRIQKIASALPWILKFTTPFLHESLLAMIKFQHSIINSALNEERDRNGISFLDLLTEKRTKEYYVYEKNIRWHVHDDESVIQQCIVHWFLNSLSTSNAISAALYELAHDEQVQERVRQEVDEVLLKHGGDLSMAAITEMIFLQSVIDEVFRKYGINGMIARICTRRYTFPGSNLSIDKGIPVFISQFGLQYDPKYFQDPYKFEPDRFLPENKPDTPKCVYMPFGEGPRSCIAKRLVKAVVALGVATMLHKFKVAPAFQKKIKSRAPISLGSVIPGGLFIRILRREEIQ